ASKSLEQGKVVMENGTENNSLSAPPANKVLAKLPLSRSERRRGKQSQADQENHANQARRKNTRPNPPGQQNRRNKNLKGQNRAAANESNSCYSGGEQSRTHRNQPYRIPQRSQQPSASTSDDSNSSSSASPSPSEPAV